MEKWVQIFICKIIIKNNNKLKNKHILNSTYAALHNTSLLNNESSRRSVLLQPSLLISLYLHHLSSIIIVRSHFPLCLVFILSLSLPPEYSPPSLSSASFAVMIPLPPSWWTSHSPDLVVPGFQMVWLAEGSEPTLQQLILSYCKPQGGWQGTHFSGRMRGRGQGEGLGAEGGLYNSQSCHRPTRVLKRLRLLSALWSCLKLVHKHFTISQVLCRRQQMGGKKQTYLIASGIWKGIQGDKGGRIRKRDSAGHGWQLVTPH